MGQDEPAGAYRTPVIECTVDKCTGTTGPDTHDSWEEKVWLTSIGGENEVGKSHGKS